MLTLMKLLKELTLSAMDRFRDDFCAMLLETLSLRIDGVIKIGSRSWKESRGL